MWQWKVWVKDFVYLSLWFQLTQSYILTYKQEINKKKEAKLKSYSSNLTQDAKAKTTLKDSVCNKVTKGTTRRRPQLYNSYSSPRFSMLLTPQWALLLCCRGSPHNTCHRLCRRLFRLDLNMCWCSLLPWRILA